MLRGDELHVAPVARPRRLLFAERVEHDRTVVFEELDQRVGRARGAGELEGDVELVQRLAMAAERTQRPRQVGTGGDLVVPGAARLHLREPLAHGSNRAIGAAEQDLEPLDVAGDVPGCECVAASLGHGAGAPEQAQRLARIGFHGDGVARIERRQVRAGVRAREFRGGAVEVHGTEDVQDLHEHVVVAARLGSLDGAIGERERGLVVGAGEQDGDAYAQRERGVSPVAGALELGQQRVDDPDRVGIASLNVRELRLPRPHMEARACIGRQQMRRLRGAFELAQRFRMIALAQQAEGDDEVQLDTARGRPAGRKRIERLACGRRRAAELAGAGACPQRGRRRGSRYPLHEPIVPDRQPRSERRSSDSCEFR